MCSSAVRHETFIVLQCGRLCFYVTLPPWSGSRWVPDGGYVADRELSRRYGRHVRGRFAANWALMTCYFAGLGGASVLWNGGRGGGDFSRGQFVAPYQWHWSEAIAFALIGGFLVGALMTWVRRPPTYMFDIPESSRFTDEAEDHESPEREKHGGS
jgi:hypothetical protein